MNAILLAAGFGSRMGELTKKTPKSLLPVGGRPNLERTLDFLLDANIHEIYLVLGYRAFDFSETLRRYPMVRPRVNERYDVTNNMTSFQKTLDVFGNSFVIDADVVLFENIFDPPEESTYFTVRRKTKEREWVPRLSEGRVQGMEITASELPSLSGISYWTEEAAHWIRKDCEKLREEDLTDPSRYWDELPLRHFDKFVVRSVELKPGAIDEMDNPTDYERILARFEE